MNSKVNLLLLSLEDAVTYLQIKEKITKLGKEKRTLAEKLSWVNKELTKSIKTKWAFEEKTIFVEVLPARKKGTRRRKAKSNLTGFSKEDNILLLEEAKKRGYI